MEKGVTFSLASVMQAYSIGCDNIRLLNEHQGLWSIVTFYCRFIPEMAFMIPVSGNSLKYYSGDVVSSTQLLVLFFTFIKQ